VLPSLHYHTDQPILRARHSVKREPTSLVLGFPNQRVSSPEFIEMNKTASRNRKLVSLLILLDLCLPTAALPRLRAQQPLNLMSTSFQLEIFSLQEVATSGGY